MYCMCVLGMIMRFIRKFRIRKHSNQDTRVYLILSVAFYGCVSSFFDGSGGGGAMFFVIQNSHKICHGLKFIQGFFFLEKCMCVCMRGWRLGSISQPLLYLCACMHM